MPRLKVDPKEAGALYHAYSRTVAGEWLFSEWDKEKFRQMAWLLADYCGLELFTHTEMSNHFHLLVNVPPARPVPDAELLRRYQLLHPRPTPDRPENIAVLEAMLREDGPQAEAWRSRILATMGDISEYMKLLKQHFTQWYNRVYGRFGTLWSERFGSVLVESGTALAAMMAYIDLNCVRAGIVEDPKDFRFCGYAEAVAGNLKARKGLCVLFGSEDWEKVHAAYRRLLFTVGATPREKAKAIAAKHFEQVMKEGGQLTVATLARCRVRYFTHGLALGSVVFVQEHLGRLRARTGLGLERGPKQLPVLGEWGEWVALRAVRRPLG